MTALLARRGDDMQEKVAFKSWTRAGLDTIICGGLPEFSSFAAGTPARARHAPHR